MQLSSNDSDGTYLLALTYLLTFAVAGPTDHLRDTALSTDSFRRVVKTRLFSEYYSTSSALEVLQSMRYINLRLTYLLPYTVGCGCIKPAISLKLLKNEDRAKVTINGLYEVVHWLSSFDCLQTFLNR